MSDPINQHYVPKTYLKSFANSQKILYQFKRRYRKISQTTISKICYEPNYFTIQREETKLLNQIKDSFFIEKNSFKKHENNYEAILKKLVIASINQFQLTKTEVRSFLEILITIKRRNPAIRNILTDNYRQYLNENMRKDIEPHFELARKVNPDIDPEEYLNTYLNDINTNPNRLHDAYLSSFLGNEKKVTEEVLNTLMQFKLIINHAPPGIQFITSDNPGFTIVDDDIITDYGGLSQKFRFVFPLTPICCLVVDGWNKEDPYVLQKPIYVGHATSTAVNLTNRGTAAVARDKVFSYSRNALIELAKFEPDF